MIPQQLEEFITQQCRDDGWYWGDRCPEIIFLQKKGLVNYCRNDENDKLGYVLQGEAYALLVGYQLRQTVGKGFIIIQIT